MIIFKIQILILVPFNQSFLYKFNKSQILKRWKCFYEHFFCDSFIRIQMSEAIKIINVNFWNLSNFFTKVNKIFPSYILLTRLHFDQFKTKLTHFLISLLFHYNEKRFQIIESHLLGRLQLNLIFLLFLRLLSDLLRCKEWV